MNKKPSFIVGREHPATCRSGQTFVAVHARVNQKEEAYRLIRLFIVYYEQHGL
nr:hypothetical protein [Ectobacillus panaciterrae]